VIEVAATAAPDCACSLSVRICTAPCSAGAVIDMLRYHCSRSFVLEAGLRDPRTRITSSTAGVLAGAQRETGSALPRELITTADTDTRVHRCTQEVRSGAAASAAGDARSAASRDQAGHARKRRRRSSGGAILRVAMYQLDEVDGARASGDATTRRLD